MAKFGSKKDMITSDQSDISQDLRRDDILTFSMGITTFSLMENQNSGRVFNSF